MSGFMFYFPGIYQLCVRALSTNVENRIEMNKVGCDADAWLKAYDKAQD